VRPVLLRSHSLYECRTIQHFLSSFSAGMGGGRLERPARHSRFTHCVIVRVYRLLFQLLHSLRVWDGVFLRYRSLMTGTCRDDYDTSLQDVFGDREKEDTGSFPGERYSAQDESMYA
jgi:hypothetical protein